MRTAFGGSRGRHSAANKHSMQAAEQQCPGTGLVIHLQSAHKAPEMSSDASISASRHEANDGKDLTAQLPSKHGMKH